MEKTKQQTNQSKNLLQEILGKYATNQSLEILVSNKIIRKNIIKFALKKIRWLKV